MSAGSRDGVEAKVLSNGAGGPGVCCIAGSGPVEARTSSQATRRSDEATGVERKESRRRTREPTALSSQTVESYPGLRCSVLTAE